jgi:hypothetical protein
MKGGSILGWRTIAGVGVKAVWRIDTGVGTLIAWGGEALLCGHLE